MNKELTFLVTGGGGYLGSVLVPMLLERGYKVKVLDRFFWGKKVFGKYFKDKNLILIEADTRSLSEKHLQGVDVVMDLASLSNDPIGELNPEKTLEINFEARVHTAKMAKKIGVKRYILASTCSVYGFREAILHEQSKTAPVTTYARASALTEKSVLPLASKDFSVTVLRQGTLYGDSPRMRFDLVLNTMVLSFFRNGNIAVFGGEQWRPILHVADSARAFIKVAEVDVKKINRQIFNVGSDGQNYQIKKLAKLVSSSLKSRSEIITQNIQSDFRSYRVSFAKIKKVLNFKTMETPQKTSKKIHELLKDKTLRDTIETRTIDWYKHLLSKNPKILDIK